MPYCIQHYHPISTLPVCVFKLILKQITDLSPYPCEVCSHGANLPKSPKAPDWEPTCRQPVPLLLLLLLLPLVLLGGRGVQLGLVLLPPPLLLLRLLLLPNLALLCLTLPLLGLLLLLLF